MDISEFLQGETSAEELLEQIRGGVPRAILDQMAEWVESAVVDLDLPTLGFREEPDSGNGFRVRFPELNREGFVGMDIIAMDPEIKLQFIVIVDGMGDRVSLEKDFEQDDIPREFEKFVRQTINNPDLLEPVR